VTSVRRIWIPLWLPSLSISGVAVAADAWVVTEREELDGFVDDVTSERVDTRLDAALSYVNTGEVACKLKRGRRDQAFGQGEKSELATTCARPSTCSTAKSRTCLQHSVHVDGEHATVTARLGDDNYEQYRHLRPSCAATTAARSAAWRVL